MFHTLVYMKHTNYPGLKFKVSNADGSMPKNKTMLFQALLMNMLVPNTAEALMHKCALAQVIQVLCLCGPNMGCTTLVFWNDSQNRRYKVHHQEVDGPITSLARKTSAYPSKWLHWYMISELKWSEGTVRSIMNGVSKQARHSCHLAK